ncbi:cupin domain-containing protein [Chelativorans sp. YIM 93263]|uniref:cupin domain-containing protein n=1 Tax=Chelativorans sp. YIM 93263 TaxID=2906648 RepID=UPI00237A060B|nr:cupin domain-containing protein [Chelativorans sp. YIM 93263]
MPEALKPQHAESVEIRMLKPGPGNGIPNNDRYPAVLAKKALGDSHDDMAVRALLESNGWGGTWTWRVFDYHHFHPDAFEALAVASGTARLILGGPQGDELEVEPGDVAILPPGFGHKQISGSSDFRICGAYPPGQEDYAVIRAEQGFGDEMLRQIEAVPFPQTDPVWGGEGPLLTRLKGSG